MEPTFSDHFSRQSAGYSKYRLQYPPALFRHLAGLPGARGLAWDCATGSGQAARGLTPYFDRIIATDGSRAQLAHAAANKKINYLVMPAERTGIKSDSIDLIVVAQALHWFDFKRFYREAVRVLKQDGIIAAWSYQLADISPAINRIMENFHYGIIGDYWPPERRHVDNGYRDIPFPFRRLKTPVFRIRADWTAERYFNYLRTWSAVVYYRERNGACPVDLIIDEVLSHWGAPATKREIRWTLTLLVGRMDT